MKIVQALGWYFPDSLGGTETYVAGLCRRLRAAGHDVMVVAPHTMDQQERAYDYDGVPVYRYPVGRARTRLEMQGLVPFPGTQRLRTWLTREKPHVFHVHTVNTALGLWEIRAAREAGARVIVTSHESTLGYLCQRGTLTRWGTAPCDGRVVPRKCAACALHHRGLPKALAAVVGTIPPRWGRIALALPGRVGTALSMSNYIHRRQAMQRELLELADTFVVLTEWALQAVLANGASPQKVVVNRLGSSHTAVTAKPGPQVKPTEPPVTIGYLGRLDPIKGVLDLAHAAASLPRSVQFRVEFRGPANGATGEQVRSSLQRIAENDQRIIVRDPVPPDKVPRVLAGYDALCCPSVCLEGGPTVAIEAHAVGTPVVGTCLGGLAELVTDGLNGRLVPPGDRRALAETIRDIALNPRGTIDRWRQHLPLPRTMDDIAADYLAQYERVLALRAELSPNADPR